MLMDEIETAGCLCFTFAMLFQCETCLGDLVCNVDRCHRPMKDNNIGTSFWFVVVEITGPARGTVLEPAIARSAGTSSSVTVNTMSLHATEEIFLRAWR